MTAHHHPSALPKGHRIDEYEIVRVLGAGGFGITYLAFDHQLDGPIALKEYFPAAAARRVAGRRVAPSATENRAVFTWGLDRFIDEARSIHRFRHPNVARAHRYLEAHGTAYIVMEYVEGRSLQRVLDGLVGRLRLSVDQWRRWLDALLDGLAHIHDHGFLHRDIKPANLMIRAGCLTPVLIDFGAARMAARDRTHTQVLTPGYAPIEQYSSEGLQGPPTDIYALAAVSYRVLTGEPLSSAPDRVLDDDFEPLAGRIARADPQWLAAIDHGLALRPEDRPQEIPAWRAAMRRRGRGARTGRAEADRNGTGGPAGRLPAHDSPPPRRVNAVRRFLAPYEEAFCRARRSPGPAGAVLRYIFASLPADDSPPACRAALSWKDWWRAAVYLAVLCVLIPLVSLVFLVAFVIFIMGLITFPRGGYSRRGRRKGNRGSRTPASAERKSPTTSGAKRVPQQGFGLGRRLGLTGRR